MKDTFVVVGIVAALVLGFVGLSQPAVNLDSVVSAVVEQVKSFGANPGPVYTNYQQFLADAGVAGGIYATTTTAATETLTGTLLDKNKTIRFLGSATAAAITVTLPASTTFPLARGEFRTWVLENGYTGAATTTTIAAGTGVDLQEPDGQNVVIGINNYAFITCFREASSDVVCSIDETIPAD